jgi:general secretion pathway protein G
MISAKRFFGIGVDMAAQRRIKRMRPLHATFSIGGRLDIRAFPPILPTIMTFSSRSLRTGRRTASSGFTLLEIIIALGILSMLVGIAVVNLGGTFDNAQITTAKLFVNDSIKLPLMSYKIHLGDFPSTAEGLTALTAAPASRADQWHGPYLADGKLPLDPWGEPYGYRNPGVKNKSGYDVFSKGPDKTEGTADDIGNW